MVNERFCVSVLVDEVFYFIRTHREQLAINDLLINLPYQISSVAIGKNMIFLTTEKHEVNDDISVDQLKNNIYAYDFFGNYLWSIEDKMQSGFTNCPLNYDEVSFHTAHTLLKHVRPVDTNKDAFNRYVLSHDTHEYLVCRTVYGIRNTFDITDGIMIDHMQNC